MKILWALFITMVIAAGSALADTVYLKNGTSVEGKIVEDTPESVKVDIGGVTLTYYRDEVLSVEKVPEAPAPLPSLSEPITPIAATIDPAKEKLIRRFVVIYGVKENMQANFDQMTKTLKPEQAEAFRNSIKVDEIIELLLPVYDKHFTEKDLQAYIDFYDSEEGKKLVASLPLLMKDSVDVSMNYLDVHLPESLKQKKAPASGN